ncbi:hypothetical protein WA026_005094 [Henosepilachna vigintioctopunctata]|uniref:Uncharacterized protein n=1 Tax=Henosepilachna vigintioctopunctata TaxID=420089 RepID=A0AAW1USK0_9CUCU
MIIPVLSILSIINFSYSYDNSSSIFDKINVINKSAFESRQSKLLSFATLDDKIAVELSFSVPFLTIPTKKTWSMAQGSMANINVGSLVLTGGIVAAVTLIMPLLLGNFNKQIMAYPSWQKADNYRGKYKNNFIDIFELSIENN